MELAEYMAHDATGLAELVARGEVTPAELLALARERAAQVDPALNAIVRRLDDFADTRAAGELQGPFAGVPFLVKDLLQEVAGFPTSGGCRALVDDVADRNALVVDRFLEAGVVIFGKTNTPELGIKGISEPELWGAARNPWDTERTPGGSSGGSGAAVAAGIVPAAGANDGGGSIRIPAACNGLVGLKLSRGLTPYGPQGGEPMFGLVSQGVVTRTVRDTAAFADAIAGPPRHPDFPGASKEMLTELIGRAPRTLRIGFTAQSAINPRVDPEAIAAVQQTAALLSELGHEVEEVAPPHDDAKLARDFLSIYFAIFHGQVTDIKRRTGASDRDFEADTLAIAELGRAAGIAGLMDAVGGIHEHVAALGAFHERYDLLLTPTLAQPPIPVGSTSTAEPLQRAARVVAKLRGGRLLALTGILDDLVNESLGWVPYTQLANITGRPAISVPTHWTKTGLPLGVQLVGDLLSDGTLLQLAAQLEEARPWIDRFPAAG